MSKFPNLVLFGGSVVGFAATAGLAITFADRNVADVPANNPTIAFDVNMPEPTATEGAETPIEQQAAAELEPETAPTEEAAVEPAPERAPVEEAAADPESESAPMEEAAADPALQEDTTEVATAESVDTAKPMPEDTAVADAPSRDTTMPRSAGYGLGRAALPEEIAAWDLDILPDGTGLPEGSGDVLTGEEVFADKCAACHGDFAEGVDNWPKLAGGWDTLADKDPVKTVGSYWPYLSTVWDYVHRSMPFGAAQTLEPDEVYAITAYILYSNDIVDEDFTLSRENFLEVEMPNADGFIVDDRAETEYTQWRAEPCMSDCKDSVEITMRATVLDVTPDEEGEEEAFEDAAMEVNAEESESTPEDKAAAAITEPALDEALVAAGAKVFNKCKSCHQVGEDAKSKTGPVLNGIVGHAAAKAEGFRYSRAMEEAAEAGLIWTEEELAAFLSKPKDYMKGTKMSFVGLRKEADVAAIVEYLKSFPAE